MGGQAPSRVVEPTTSGRPRVGWRCRVWGEGELGKGWNRQQREDHSRDDGGDEFHLLCAGLELQCLHSYLRILNRDFGEPFSFLGLGMFVQYWFKTHSVKVYPSMETSRFAMQKLLSSCRNRVCSRFIAANVLMVERKKVIFFARSTVFPHVGRVGGRSCPSVLGFLCPLFLVRELLHGRP